MTKVLITDAAAVTALGDLETTWTRLLRGDTGIQKVQRFSTEKYETDFAAMVPDLASEDGHSLIYPLLDRLFAKLGPIPPKTRLVTATTKAGIDELESYSRDELESPMNALAPELLTYIAERFDLCPPHLNINAACASSTIAIGRAAAAVRAGAAEAVLVVSMDLVSEFVLSGFSALKGISPTPSRPFDRNRTGLTLGEGAAAILLMSEEAATANNAVPLAEVAGWGTANDANHITAPARDGCGLIQACNDALRRANLAPDQIAAISAHGTGTVYNDLMELKAFHTVFNGIPLPTHSVKGALGHTLGAAGGIQVALAVKSLATNCIPPTVGFNEPEEGAEEMVSHRLQSFEGDYLISTNSGFGGINGVVIIGKGDAK